MTRSIVFAAPGDLSTPTGGFAYDRRIVDELRAMETRVDVVDLGAGFPWPRHEHRKSAQATLSALPAGSVVVVDGLALGAMPEAALGLSERCALVALVHHPLCKETGLAPARASTLFESERVALSHAHRIVTTSRTTRQLLAAEFGVSTDRVVVAPPGNDASRRATGSVDDVVRVLAVGAVTHRKGFDVLIGALATLKDLSWKLTIVGSRDWDLATVAALDIRVRRNGLAERVAFLGVVSAERLDELYVGSDLFALASRYEGYGMAYSEAIAHGLPVVGTTGGAIPETVPEGAGWLVAPEDPAALAVALRSTIGNFELRRDMARRALAAACKLPTWRDSALAFTRVFDELVVPGYRGLATGARAAERSKSNSRSLSSW